MSDHNHIPADFDEFYAIWQPFVRLRAANRFSDIGEIDSFVAEFFSDIYIGDYLNKYNPALGPFSHFMRSQVHFRLIQYHKVFTLKRRAEASIEDDEYYLNIPTNDNRQHEADVRCLINQTIISLKACDTPSWSYSRLFCEMIRETELDGTVSRKHIAERYALSGQRIGQRIGELLKLEPMIKLREALRS